MPKNAGFFRTASGYYVAPRAIHCFLVTTVTDDDDIPAQISCVNSVAASRTEKVALTQAHRQTDTHTHTHTQRERERDDSRNRCPQELVLYCCHISLGDAC